MVLQNNYILLLSVTFLLSIGSVVGAGALGDGSDGNLTVTTSDRVINDYAYIGGDESSGSNSIAVNSASDFETGDEIMIVQMQEGGTACNAGEFEFKKITQISGDTLQLNESLEHSYCYNDPEVGKPINKYNPPSGDHTSSVAQVVEIPHYRYVNIQGSVTAPYWNGVTGGIVAFRATETVSITGEINVKARGFRGGAVVGGTGDDDDGGQGEGITGWGIQGSATGDDGRDNSNTNGGGGNVAQNNDGGDGAAGGSYGTQGQVVQAGCDSYCPSPGNTVGVKELTEIYFGGGGGGGSDSDDPSCTQNPFASDPDGNADSQPNLCQRGGHGGGIVFVAAGKIENTDINANGHTTRPVWDGGPGGGAGGTVWLRAKNITVDSITATGGPTVCGHKKDEDCGGAGGNGRIRLDYDNITGLSNTNPSVGYEGPAPETFTICDMESPNTCNITDRHEIGTREIVSDKKYLFKPSASLISTGKPLINISNVLELSGYWEGRFTLKAQRLVIKPGTELRPGEDRILIREN